MVLGMRPNTIQSYQRNMSYPHSVTSLSFVLITWWSLDKIELYFIHLENLYQIPNMYQTLCKSLRIQRQVTPSPCPLRAYIMMAGVLLISTRGSVLCISSTFAPGLPPVSTQFLFCTENMMWMATSWVVHCATSHGSPVCPHILHLKYFPLQLCLPTPSWCTSDVNSSLHPLLTRNSKMFLSSQTYFSIFCL